MLPDVVLTVSCTVPPSQKVVVPLADMLPMGAGLTVTAVPAEVELQPSAVAVTEYVPEAFTVIDCVVAPLLHSQLTPLMLVEAVSVTLPPAQNVVLPLADIVGLAGLGFTVTAMLWVLMAVQPGEYTRAE